MRLALLSGHYRQPLEFSVEALQSAKAVLDKWYGALRATPEAHTAFTPVPAAIEEALLDDLNTPLAIAHIHDLVNKLNRAHSASEQGRVGAAIVAAGNALGLLHQTPEVWFRWHPANQSAPTDAEIDAQIAARLAARKAKNYAESDRIRDALAAQGVILEDGAGGTTWRRG